MSTAYRWYPVQSLEKRDVSKRLHMSLRVIVTLDGFGRIYDTSQDPRLRQEEGLSVMKRPDLTLDDVCRSARPDQPASLLV